MPKAQANVKPKDRNQIIRIKRNGFQQIFDKMVSLRVTAVVKQCGNKKYKFKWRHLCPLLKNTRWSGDVVWRTGKKNFNAVSHNRARP